MHSSLRWLLTKYPVHDDELEFQKFEILAWTGVHVQLYIVSVSAKNI
jgi:hypothetical protein